jgi:hypothetical protein
MDRIFKFSVVFLFAAAMVYLAIDHATDETKRHSAVGLAEGIVGIDDSPDAVSEPKLTSEQKLQQMRDGVYTPEIVDFATSGYEDEVAGDRFLHPDGLALEYLAYLIEGAAKYPASVDFCQRVLPRIKESYRLIDAAFGKELSAQQLGFLDRIKLAYSQVEESGETCREPSPVQQVST